MTPAVDPVALGELVERVERASGADRELDAAIWTAATGQECYSRIRIAWGIKGGPRAVPALTRSVDAALALIERVLPGCRLVLILRPAPPQEYDPFFPCVGFTADGQTPPLAICLALLRALQAQQVNK